MLSHASPKQAVSLLCLALCTVLAHGQEGVAVSPPSGMQDRSPAGYNASLIVKNVLAYCPVTQTLWSPEQFSVDQLVAIFGPVLAVVANNTTVSSQPCTQQAQGLITCAFDGSLQVKEGCCSQDCATKMSQVVSDGCLDLMIGFFCANATWSAQILTVAPMLLNAARRCAAYQAPALVPCPSGGLLSVGANDSITFFRQPSAAAQLSQGINSSMALPAAPAQVAQAPVALVGATFKPAPDVAAPPGVAAAVNRSSLSAPVQAAAQGRKRRRKLLGQ